MPITLLYFDDCPNWQVADMRLRTALALLGRSHTEIRYRRVSTYEQAVAEEFHGSPTLLVNGTDPFPTDAAVGLACRIYRTQAGSSGCPSVDQLLAVLTAPS